eukprot:1282389-Alexandrium_andersonii.AAC.1
MSCIVLVAALLSAPISCSTCLRTAEVRRAVSATAHCVASLSTVSNRATVAQCLVFMAALV